MPISDELLRDSKPVAPTPTISPELLEGTEQLDAPAQSTASGLETFGRSTLRGVADSLPIAGGVAGIPLGGPGIVIGAGLGTIGRGALIDFADLPAAEELPPDARSTGFAGEFLGGAVTGVGAPLALARTGFRTGMRFFDRVLDTAATRPGTVLATEVGAGGTGALATGVANEVDPDNPTTRIPAGVVGSVVSPTGLINSGVTAVTGVINRLRTAFSRSGRESEAARSIQNALTQAGEDPAALAGTITQLRAELPANANPTSAQLTGSPVLMDLSAELARSNAQFGRESIQRAQESIDIMRAAAERLSVSGNPDDLKAAAELRRMDFTQMLSHQVQKAEEEAVQMAARIGPTTPERVSEISKRGTAIVQGALDKARAAERQLYSKVTNGPAQPDKTLAAIDAVEQELATAVSRRIQHLPPFMARFRAPFRSGEARTPVGAVTSNISELRKFRSLALGEAREAAANGKVNLARRWGMVAEGALDDLNAAGDPDGTLTAAREFSRSLNDVFTRSFAGKLDDVNSTGAPRLPPELALRRALGTGQEVAALHARELNEAVRLRTPDGKLVAPEALDELLVVEEQFLRTMAEQLVDPNTGRVSARALANFTAKNAELLDEFPHLRAQFDTAENAERALVEISKRTANADRIVDRRAAFAAVANAENPVLAVSRILSGSSPQEGFRQLAITARRSGPDAVAGLQSSVMDDAFQRAGGGTDAFSFEKLTTLLTQPRRAGQPSAIDIMQQSGVMRPEDGTALKRLLVQGLRVETAQKARGGVDDLIGNTDPIMDLLERVAGARIGTAIHGIGGGGGPGAIVAAGRGSEAVRKIMEKVPNGKVMDIIIEAAKDPVFMEKLLTKRVTPREKIQWARELNAFLIQRGLTVGGAAATQVPEGAPSEP